MNCQYLELRPFTYCQYRFRGVMVLADGVYNLFYNLGNTYGCQVSLTGVVWLLEYYEAALDIFSHG